MMTNMIECLWLVPKAEMDISVTFSTLPCIEKGKIKFTVNFKSHFNSILTSVSKYSLLQIWAEFAKHGTVFSHEQETHQI